MKEGTCIICGKPFTYTRGRKMTCSEECATQSNRERTRQYKKRKREAQKAVKPKKKAINNLNKDMLAARAMGVSYGYYIAYVKGQ